MDGCHGLLLRFGNFGSEPANSSFRVNLKACDACDASAILDRDQIEALYQPQNNKYQHAAGRITAGVMAVVASTRGIPGA